MKSRYLKKGKGGRKHEEHNSEEDTSDENVLDGESDVEDSDEELKDMKIELEKLKNEKKRKLAEKKIEAEKKGLQKQKKREQGDLTCKDKKLKSAKKNDTHVTIDDLRGDKQIKAKAQKKFRKILELSSSESDIDTSENESESENSYISDSSSAACSEDVKGSNYKNIKNVNNQKVRKSRVFLIVHQTKLLKNNFGHKQNYNLNMQVRKLVLKIWNLTSLLQVN